MKKTAKSRKQISEIGKHGVKRLRWDDARVFLAIARAGSLSRAAASLGAGIASVSRQIERLEAALGLTLFSRHQNGYRLTDDGAVLLERAETLANRIVIPALPKLISRYPDLMLEIVTDVPAVNLHRCDADLAVRLVKPERGNVTIRRLGTLGFGLYASRDYAEHRQDDARLEADRFVTWCETYSHLPAARWVERALRGRVPVLATSTLSAQLSAVTSGVGLAVLPHFLGRQNNLVCLQGDRGIDQEIWLAVHSDLAQSRRVRVVANFLAGLLHEAKQEIETANLG